MLGKNMWPDLIISFFKSLPALPKLPKGIKAMNPYREEETMETVTSFYRKFYNDREPRTLMLGINPGRFGAGVTGISFTDPIRLEGICGIPNSLEKRPELSSDFVYRVIEAYGGVKKFYGRYLLSAVSPLGFTRDGKNINYYDDRKLESIISPFARECISRLAAMGIESRRCYSIGEGKNAAFLKRLNDEQQWFKEITPLPHPRFIMQYRRKQLDRYVQLYLDHLD